MTKKEKDQKVLELTFGEITSLILLLTEMPLHGQECISRNKVVNQLKVVGTAFDTEKMRLIATYADKEADGKIKLTDDKKGYSLTEENKKKFEAEFVKLLAQTATFDSFLPSVNKDFKCVATLIKNLKKDFNYSDGEVYMKLVEKLENI